MFVQLQASMWAHYLLQPSIAQLMWWTTDSANSRNSRMPGCSVESFSMPVWFMVIRHQKSLFNALLSSRFTCFGVEVHFQQENNDSSAKQTICHRINDITSHYKWIHLLWIDSSSPALGLSITKLPGPLGTHCHWSIRAFLNSDSHVLFLLSIFLAFFCVSMR